MNWKKQISLGNELSFLSGVACLIVLSGVIGRSMLLTFIGIFFLVFIYANQFYLKRVSDGVSVDVNKELIKLFKGENDEFTFTVKQESIYPLLNAKLRITIDNVLQFEQERKMVNSEQIELEIPFSLLGKQSVSLTLPFEAVKRGVAKIRTVEMRIPHLFGFGEVYLQSNNSLKLETVVYSSPTIVGGVEKILPRNVGDYPIKQSYFEDMSAIIGARRYVSSDPFNRVHWKATAKTNEMQTKLFEKTSQFSWTLMINVRTSQLENLLDGITYLLEHATKKNIPFEIFVNVRKAGSVPFIYLPTGVGKEHLQKALEIIARLSKHSVTIPFHQMIYTASRKYQLSPYVMIVGEIEHSEPTVIGGLNKRGIECYKVAEQEETVILTKYHQPGRKVHSRAI